MDIRGRDMVSGFPLTITIHSSEVQEALWDPVSIVTAAKAYWSERRRSYRQILLTGALF